MVAEAGGQPKVASAFVVQEQLWGCREELALLLSLIS